MRKRQGPHDDSPVRQGAAAQTQGGQAPFIHLFQTARHRYAFDVNTRRILRLSPAVWDLLADFGAVSDAAAQAKVAATHGKRAAAAAVKQVADAMRQGLLLPNRPAQVVSMAQENVRLQLDRQRQQLILSVTEACNFRCRYCVYGGQYPAFRSHSNARMPWSVARAAIDDFLAHSAQAGERTITFYGGEPLLGLPLIRRCVAHVKSRTPAGAVQFGLTTNGWLLDASAGRWLADEQFALVVSLDGPEAIHDNNRRTRAGDPTWARITANVRAFLARHPEYRTNGRLRFSAVAADGADLRQVQVFVMSCDLFEGTTGLDVTSQKRTGRRGRGRSGAATMLQSSMAELRGEFVRDIRAPRFGVERTRRNLRLKAALFEKPFVMFHRRGLGTGALPARMQVLNTCVPGVRRAMVGVAGDIFPCERTPGTEAMKIGHVSQGIDPARVLALLGRWSRGSADNCRRCWCLGTCRVGCFANIPRPSRPAMAKACTAFTQSAHNLLVEYCSILEDNPSAFDYVDAMVVS